MHRFRSAAVPALALTALALAGLALAAAPGLLAQETTDDEKIASAVGAAPPEVAAGATVLDWPAEAGADFRVLREGTNGWTCLPPLPDSPNYDPMCNDAEWMEWVKAYAAGQPPTVKKVGLSYMLNARWAVSNTDPMATGPTPDNQWHEGGAHLMVIVPDPALLAGFPDEPGPGAYVMFKGTPYVHLMIPMSEEGHGGH